MSGMEDGLRLSNTNPCASTLLCSFDLPRVVWSSILAKDIVVDVRIDVLGIDESAVYIEDACAYWRQ